MFTINKQYLVENITVSTNAQTRTYYIIIIHVTNTHFWKINNNC